MGGNVSLVNGHIDTDIENQSICHSCFYSDVCEQFNENRHIIDNKKCHFYNDHFVAAADMVEVVRCKDCIHFSEYHETYKPKVENADGDCFYRLVHSCDKQFFTVSYDDFCSYGERKGKE